MIRLLQTRIATTLVTVFLVSCVANLAEAQSNANLRLMPVGDSITAGYLSTTNNGYRGPLWTALASQVATQDFVGTQIDGTMSDPDNEGHYGYRIDQIAGLINSSLATYKPNIVTLDIGINDLGQNYEVSTAPSRLASLIDQILASEPDATVLVAQLIVNATASVESEVVTFNDQLPAIVQSRASAGKHVYLVDMSALTTADLSDGLHPNDTGYQLMANAWDTAVQEVISNGWITHPLAGSATRPVGAFYSGVSGMCLDDFTDSQTKGIKAVISACNGSSEQQLNINNGAVTINNLCLDVVGGGTANQTLVDFWSCTGASNQLWTSQNGTLLNPASGRCLDDPGFSTVNGTQLQIYDCNGGTNQRWQIPSEGSLSSGVKGLCLDDQGGLNSNGTKSTVSQCNSSGEQQWKVTNNTVQFDGGCLDVTGGGTANGTPVHLWTCNGVAGQIWQYVNGTLVNPVSGRCLADPGSSTINGTQLQILGCDGGAEQQWTLPPM